jgi:hypothetical protein
MESKALKNPRRNSFVAFFSLSLSSGDCVFISQKRLVDECMLRPQKYIYEERIDQQETSRDKKENHWRLG